MEKYLLVEYSGGRDLLFWRPDAKGYTTNLKEAGIYDGTERVECPIITKDNLPKMYADGVKSIYINVNDLNLIGEEAIVNKVLVKRKYWGENND